MPYRFLEDVAIADVAFEATGKTLKEMFESSALAVTNTMVKNPSKIGHAVEKKFKVKGRDVEMLLFEFLQELVFYKDSESLIFNEFDMTIEPKKGSWSMSVVARGEKIDMRKHEMLVDVKAVTFHNFKVGETEDGWSSQVVLDV
jgi:SHS2 domain-containing protein